MDSLSIIEIIDLWSPRWWRVLVQGVVLTVVLGLLTHQAGATYLIQHGFSWLMQQEQHRLHPLIKSVTDTIQPKTTTTTSTTNPH